MRRLILASSWCVASALAVGACTPATDAGEATPPAEAATPASVDETVAMETTPAAPTMTLEAACRQAVETNYGQTGVAVSFDAATAAVSWRAPVDGGRLNFTCAVDGDAVTLTRDGQTQVVALNASAGATAQEEAH